jgi:MerR family copper efflux transcriptional regulator
VTISEAAKLSQVTAKSIRRYEDEGLIPRAGRSTAGYRIYTEKDVHVLRFVKRARELGFSMKDIKELLGLWKNKQRSSAQVKAIAERHLRVLERRIAEINGMVKTLKHLSKNCHGDQRPDCPILDDLAV